MASKKEKPETEKKKTKTTKKKPPQKRGPKNKIQDSAITAAKYMAMCGMIDVQIAKELGIATSTLYAWKKKFPELSEALKNGKIIADGKVIEGLHKRATGFEYVETHTQTIKIKKEDGSEEETEAEEIKRVTKYTPPDTTAIIYWLNNRRPDLWRNVNHIKHSGNIGGENEEIQQQLENNPEAADALQKLYRLQQGMGSTSKD